MLVDAYEQLRHDAIIAPTRGGSLRGLAILIRKGMVAWMHACATAAAAAVVVVPPAVVDGVRMPPGVQREVIDVLAAMALGTAMEVRT
jgi:hypothetical protein